MKLFTNKKRSKFSFFFAISHPEKTIASEIDLQTDLSSYFEILSMELLFAYLIEIFGLFGVEKTEFQWSKVLGLGLSIIGIIIVKWK